MDNIEIFDLYIKGKLSGQECLEFKNRLNSDPEFASDYKIYLFTINGICREIEQDNIDFGLAMKKLNKEQLRNIIGSPQKVKGPKSIGFRPWVWQTISIAAVVLIAFTVVFQIEKYSRYTVDKAIYASNSEGISLWRSGAEQIDITKLTDIELQNRLPQIKETYDLAIDEQEIADTGYTLVLAYIRLHDRENAEKLLNQLINKFDGNEAFQGYVTKCKTILDLIK